MGVRGEGERGKGVRGDARKARETVFGCVKNYKTVKVFNKRREVLIKLLVSFGGPLVSIPQLGARPGLCFQNKKKKTTNERCHAVENFLTKKFTYDEEDLRTITKTFLTPKYTTRRRNPRS